MNKEFMDFLEENKVLNEDKLLKEKIFNLFQSLIQNVEQGLKKQETIMTEIEKWNKIFVNERHGSGSEKREDILKLLATSYDVFVSLNDNLKEGTNVS